MKMDKGFLSSHLALNRSPYTGESAHAVFDKVVGGGRPRRRVRAAAGTQSQSGERGEMSRLALGRDVKRPKECLHFNLHPFFDPYSNLVNTVVIMLCFGII